MEITELTPLLGDFNPSLFSRISPQLYSFWTLGALIVAVFATFTSVIDRIKMFIREIRVKFFVSDCKKSEKIYDDFDFEFDSSSDDDNDEDTPSSVAESDDEDDYRRHGGEVFRDEGNNCYWGETRGQDGNFTLRRRNGFSWSDFSAGKSVVQLWDSFGLGLDFDDVDGYEIGISDRPCEVMPAAEICHDRGAGLGDCDERVAEEIYAAWRPPRK